MKRLVPIAPMLAICWGILFAPTQRLHAQSGTRAQKFEELANVLKLTPRQKIKLAPILKEEAPKVEAIKSDPSLGKIQKLEQLKAVHEQTDPEVKSILTPGQYQMLQEIRQKEVEQAINKTRTQ